MVSQNNGALSLQYGFCGALSDATGPRYLSCAPGDEEPTVANQPTSNADADANANAELSETPNALFDPNMQERKDEIDALRARVDVILNKMVQNSGDDVHRLRQKIAEMRTGPPQPPKQQQQQLLAKPWGAAVMGCPMSPAMTTISKASATPSADTEVHGNLASNRKNTVHKQGSLLGAEVAHEDDRDDDEDIDNMAFDFGVAPLSMSKSVQLAEVGSIAASRTGKESKDPPASLKASESMLPLPDPGGDDSYCSGSSRCESPPPGSLLFEAAARKADSVIGREKMQQQKQRKSAPPTPEGGASKNKPTKAAAGLVPATASAQAKQQQGVAKAPSSDPPATPPATQQQQVQVQIHQKKLQRSPPPPVINVNIPQTVEGHSSDRLGMTASGSVSESSLSRPPSRAGDEITMVEEVTEQRIRDPYGDKGLYTGVLVKRRPHGRGTMKYDDGRHYEGHWNHGRWHGVGRAIFANHDIFEGSYDMDQRHGHGMYQWKDGRVYTGQFFQDQRQGRGTYTWPDGAVYQGEFKAGHRHGQGMYRFADGSVYTGEWENGKYHGVGECRWSDGRSYRGEWKDGRANGYGVETRPNGTIRHDGEWKEDRPIRDSKRNAQEDGVTN